MLFSAQRWSSAAAGEERSDEPDVGWNDLLGLMRARAPTLLWK
jgi:hypothetical protein